jgi:hypothetical protein
MACKSTTTNQVKNVINSLKKGVVGMEIAVNSSMDRCRTSQLFKKGIWSSSTAVLELTVDMDNKGDALTYILKKKFLNLKKIQLIN